MAATKEQTTTASQGVNLKGATLPDGDVQAVRERRDTEDARGSFQGELHAQLPMMPPVLLSPTGIRFPSEQTQDNGLTVRVVGAPSALYNPDIAIRMSTRYSRLGDFVGDAEAIVEVPSLPSMIDSLIELSKEHGSHLADIRIITHGQPGQILMGKHIYSLNDPSVKSEFQRLKPFLADNATISFHGCDVGQETQGLQNIANVTGVTIKASLDEQFPDRKGLQGRVITITPLQQK